MLPFLGYLVWVFALTVVLILVLRKVAPTIGLIDKPGGRKIHDLPIPVVGGVAMYLSFLLLCVWLWPFPITTYGSLIAGMTLMVVVGTLDDRFELPAWARLWAQIVAALLMTSWGLIQVRDLGDLVGLGAITLGDWSIPFTVICAVALMNAINMIDGIDGLAGSVALVAVIAIAIVAALSGLDSVSVPMLMALAAALAAFLVFNARNPLRRQALVFMGDAGSMMLGFAIAWFAVYVSQARDVLVPSMTIAWILAVPMFDVLSVTVRRLIEGRNPFLSAHDHMHHMLLKAGLGTRKIVRYLTLMALASASIGIAGWLLGTPEWVLLLAYLVAWGVHMWILISGWRHLRVNSVTRSVDQRP